MLCSRLRKVVAPISWIHYSSSPTIDPGGYMEDRRPAANCDPYKDCNETWHENYWVGGLDRPPFCGSQMVKLNTQNSGEIWHGEIFPWINPIRSVIQSSPIYIWWRPDVSKSHSRSCSENLVGNTVSVTGSINLTRRWWCGFVLNQEGCPVWHSQQVAIKGFISQTQG